MLKSIIRFSLQNKLIILFFTVFIIGFGLYSLSRIPIGAVPDVTNNQVQVITTSRNLSTLDVEQFITYPVELEMANLPGVKEIRSVSKFGLSVVTIVFEESMGTYLPRQLIAEKVKLASEKIPEGFGSPFMGPVTTGLGEIYQYTLDVKPGYENWYDPTSLRTIQDWVVKRQLSGIPGVVEINTWGGYLKQYEIAIKTEKLAAMNITISDIFHAIENNNSIAGGGYIEKNDQAFFIRGEGLVTSLEDIGGIVVKKSKGLPVYIRDIAGVRFGNATRFGAITGNGKGEKVLGQVMMLKDANSNRVIDDVKKRVAEISESLPEGIYINPVLDRSELIKKTTSTVAENLILGCLIVVFVVVLLLGNLRSGLVVASVIPLSLLFALSLMNLFGVDANLMSLGAIDFGIIIDGAVIIVEYIAFQITAKSKELSALSTPEKRIETDNITLKSASKLMSSAVFGQLIIMIVFIPILSLSGVEGKMFIPMAMTFCFALAGAMVLCFTYIPVAASLFLKPVKKGEKNISVRIMLIIDSMYHATIRYALKRKNVVLTSALSLFLIVLLIFIRMGGEFIPTLDEGDFVIQPVLKTGTSLSRTIETTTEIERILLDNFPEVEQVVTRIGAAEVPTDPMSMEESDVIIKLKPKSEWTSANSKDELADKFKEALSIIPNMEVEFTQPIEMRFNELITGVRADIAIKIFGEDLSVLTEKAHEIQNRIKDVQGASDIVVEKVEGLPQMSVIYDRSKIARYGLNISDINNMVSMGFGGKTFGSVFENEKRFDLVLRLEEGYRKSLKDLQNLYVDTPEGIKIPLSELATISYATGPAKISRDNTKRRIVVGINVRNRDLQSVVEDIQNIVEKDVKLPPGYQITYGGQFENLQSAITRLKVAVPIALALIFILLYFAFNSARDALMIFSAIPLSAVGGILLLWLRGLPFSISAGVGFIALFGIAVLNGIVLIEHFKELKKHGINDLDQRIIQGSRERLRPVLLTAAAAALGFLPMAISESAGAEVQRPLATVVIGGLISATLLTLVVLPVLYAIFENKEKMITFSGKYRKPALIVIFFIISGTISQAQQPSLSLDELVDLAIENNAGLRATHLKEEETAALIGSAFNFDKTSIYYSYDENDLAVNGIPNHKFGIQQDFLFPTVYGIQNKVSRARFQMEQINTGIEKNKLIHDVTAAYYNLLYLINKEEKYAFLDSLYNRFAHAAERRFETGETNYLESITAQAKQRQLQTTRKQTRLDIEYAYEDLKKLVQIERSFTVLREPMTRLAPKFESPESNIGLQYYEKARQLYLAKYQLEKQRLLPDLSLEYFQGSNSELNKNLIGYYFGLKIPILFGGQSSKIKGSKIAVEMIDAQMKDYNISLHTRINQLQAQLNKYEEAVIYYETQGKVLSDAILKTAEVSFKNGEIDFFQYIQSIENATEIELTYLENLLLYNNTVISINYLTL